MTGLSSQYPDRKKGRLINFMLCCDSTMIKANDFFAYYHYAQA